MINLEWLFISELQFVVVLLATYDEDAAFIEKQLYGS